ncbi:MAG: TolC family protein [Opitutaceae bacterium]|nr:TolC family protein [Opitutaceae bacterium]
MRLPRILLATASLLAAAAAVAQINDGQPDPGIAVPERLDLPYALGFALDNNFAIRQAKERIRQQEGIVLEVRSAQIPNVSAAGGYQRNAEDIGSNGRDHAWSVNITARQVLYSGGGVTAGVRAQQQQLDAAVLALQAVINDTLLEVRTLFYTVLVNRERIKVQEQNVELLQRQLQDVKNRFEAGTVSNFEVLRAEVALANAQPALITARNDYRLAIEELRRSLGFTNTSEASLTRVPDFLGTLEFRPASFELVSALATAREKRPDLQRLEKLEAAAEQGVIASRAGYQPDLSLFGAYDWRMNSTGSSNLSNARDGWTIGLQTTWNIFDGRATAGRVAQSRSFLEQTRLARAEAQLIVDVDVRRAISSYQQATELAEASKKVVEQAEEAVRLANARFSAGTATQLDVLTSQVDLTTARLNQLQAYYSYNVAVAAVRKAMGLPDELTPAGPLAWPMP